MVPEIISEREESKMVLDSTGVLAVEQAPQNGGRQCVCPQGELQLPPASLPRSAGRSDPDAF